VSAEFLKDNVFDKIYTAYDKQCPCFLFQGNPAKILY